MPHRTRRDHGPHSSTSRLYAPARKRVSPSAIARDVGPVIYAIRTKNGLVKIGFTTNIASRASAFGGLYALLALRPGTLDDEQSIHAALREHVAHGREYYHPTPEVLDVVNTMRQAMGFDPLAA